MIPEVGHFLLWLALGGAIVLAIVPMAGALKGREDWMAVARPAANWTFLMVLLSFILLTMAFVQHDFSVQYVASNSNSKLPIYYRISAVWGGHEG